MFSIASKHIWSLQHFVVKETSFSVPLTRIISDPASIYFSESAIAALAPTAGKGLKVENPVIITNIDSLDFARFLEVVYPISVHNLKMKDYASVIKVAQTLGMDKAKAHAIQQLEKMAQHEYPLDAIHLAHQLSLPSLFKIGLTRLVTQSKRMSEAEIARVGWKTAYRIGELREEFRIPTSPGTACFSSNSWTFGPDTPLSTGSPFGRSIQAAISSVFADEIIQLSFA